MSTHEIQTIQTAYRKRLAESWQIPAGSKVLEIGCGQGDMTAVLAEIVGPEGHVLAVDLADPTYGAPQTLEEATDLIKASPLGERIEFRFQFDVLDSAHDFGDNAFDYVVMAHSSWYFSTPSQLKDTLARVRPWARNLCFAEWDLQPQSLEQVPHLLAVLIQGQVEAFKTESLSNIRTPLSAPHLAKLIQEAGWAIVGECWVDTQDLQDADWEIAASRHSLEEAAQLGLPEKVRALLASQAEVLQKLALAKGNTSLPAYSVRAQ